MERRGREVAEKGKIEDPRSKQRVRQWRIRSHGIFYFMPANPAASSGEPIRQLAESSVKPMRSLGFKN
jgi:hypothetical protein